jgi:hypothetical protein
MQGRNWRSGRRKYFARARRLGFLIDTLSFGVKGSFYFFPSPYGASTVPPSC